MPYRNPATPAEHFENVVMNQRDLIGSLIQWETPALPPAFGRGFGFYHDVVTW